ncbi:MAG: HAD family hydrolase [Nitrososphaeria archaeon]|jgi:putative hydrolase of the HAD superfamily
MKVDHFFFGLQNTLYDTELQLSMARMNAIKAMIAEGLPLNEESTYMMLEDIVKEYGVHYPRHFDVLSERLGVKFTPKIVAAGVLAYREASNVYLKPYPDVFETLISLRDKGSKLYLITSGPSVKQWQKILALQLSHLFHNVFIEERTDVMSGFSKGFLGHIIEQIYVDKKNLLLVSGIASEINSANELGVNSALVLRGAAKYKVEEKRTLATHILSSLSELPKIV